RSIGELDACAEAFDDATRADFDAMRARYVLWSRSVEDNGWQIKTWDKQLEPWLPNDDLAHYIMVFNTECDHALATRLLGRGGPGPLDCGTGVNGLENAAIAANDQEGHLFNSFHEAAAVHALLT